MHAWERKLSLKDKNSSTLPFEWGFDFLNHGFMPGENSLESVKEYSRQWIKKSEDFFRPSQIPKFDVKGQLLQFQSSINSPYECNNTVRAKISFPKLQQPRGAVVVVPQWNASQEGHLGLCRLLARLGFLAVRLTMPYHEERNPAGPRADYMVSPNLGRTVQAIQQAVQDCRNVADWLSSIGFQKIGIMGTSVGSCITFLAFVHDLRFQVGVFNHVSSFFGDVVWNGLSTQHVRKGIDGTLDREQLRAAWAVISPNSYFNKLQNLPFRKSLYISARYDLTFPPDLAQLLFDEHHRLQVPYETAYLPCGHYTSAITPFKHLDGYYIASYFRKYLR